jgi:hypothetical protein
MIYRDLKYLNFIRNKPCVICGRKAVPHHESISHRGTGIKASDFETIPLCPECHRKRHNEGKYTFWAKHFFQSEYIVLRYKSDIDADAEIDFCLAKLIIQYQSEYIHKGANPRSRSAD